MNAIWTIILLIAFIEIMYIYYILLKNNIISNNSFLITILILLWNNIYEKMSKNKNNKQKLKIKEK